MGLSNYIGKNRVDLPKHLLGIEDLDADQINYIIGLADELKNNEIPEKYSKCFKGKKVNLHFQQESTRTKMSFEIIADYLGVLGTSIGKNESSEGKGENLNDTIRMHQKTADILVMRGEYDFRYDLTEDMLDKYNVRIINAGDVREHPTQTLLDLYVLMKKANVDDVRELDLNVTFIGDTDGYRAAQTLVKALTKYTKCNVSNIVPHRGEAMGKEWGLKKIVKLNEYRYTGVTKEVIDTENIKNLEVFDKDDEYTERKVINGKELENFISSRKQYEKQLAKGIKNADIFYFCRPTNEGKPAIVYGLTPEFLNEHAKNTAMIMHPLPRIGELSEEFDDSLRDLYLNDQPIAGDDVRKAHIFAMLIEDYFGMNKSQKCLSDFPDILS